MQLFSVGANSDDDVGVNFADNNDASLLHMAIAANECYNWASRTGPPNPITGTVAKMNFYSSSLNASEIDLGVLIT